MVQISLGPFANLRVVEKLWSGLNDRADQHHDDYVGGDNIVSRLLADEMIYEVADCRAWCRTLLNGLQNGGPTGLIYGYLFVWCGASLQALVMAEMGSM